MLILAPMSINAQIPLSVKNQPIHNIINIIVQKADYSSFFAENIQELDNGITIKGQTEKDKKKVSGKVTDINGEALVGVTVKVYGEKNGSVTNTDVNGNYIIYVPDNSKLEFSYIGFNTVVSNISNSNICDIILKESTELLEGIVVVGYGSMKRKDLTTAVSIVSTEDIEARPIMSAAKAIQGKAAGIQVVQPSGMPGTGLTIRVRGTTSVEASNEPLYIVDDIPCDDISGVSPNDIESIQILKDASSAAIYGARAANGVVLITTKRGKINSTVIKLNMFTGFSKLGKKIDALNTAEYKELMSELKKVSTVAPSIPEDENRYVDWTDLFFRTGINQNYQLSLASGSEKFKYYISGGYSDEQGIVKKAKFNRYNFRANLDSKQTKWLKMSLNFSYSHTLGQWVYESRSSMRSGSILSVINTPPFMQEWDPYNPKRYDEQAYGARILNPLAANAADNKTNTDLLTGSFSVTVDILKGLKFKSRFGIDLNNSHWNYYLDPERTSDGRSTKGRVEESFSRNYEWLLENILTYDLNINKNSFSFLGGATQQHAQYNDSWLAGFDLSESYPEIHSISAANQIDKNSCGSSASAWSISSFIGRVNYNYDSRYLLTANFRADGSSKFAPKHRWGFFPSVSVGWRVSEESFMESIGDSLDDLKLRIGWGINGNQGGFGNYAYLASMSASRVPPTSDNLYPGMAISPVSAANKELTWEKTEQYNLGADVSIFNSRVSLSIDAYYKKTRDLLMTVNLPDNVIPSIVIRNDGEMENKGMEFSLSTRNFVNSFKWNTDFNISFNKNKLTKLGLNKVYYYASTYETKENAIILKEGLPIGTFFGYISEGVDSETGDIIYKDLNNNGYIDPNDRTTLGNAQPDFIYGMTNSFSYKGFDLLVFLQGSQGNKIFNASRIDMESMMDFRNQSKRVLDRWKRPGMITKIPRVGNIENIHNSSRFVEDGSYLRLKTVTLTYNFPKNLISKIGLSKVQLYVTGENLFTITRYKGYDPEVNAYGSNSVAQGVDYGTYPQSKAIILGLNVEL
jgi:TonB-linked outer membrane protein, SusC/RagA family/TonB-dependent outer membrane receptor, SusC/RagA subfamily, signature region